MRKEGEIKNTKNFNKIAGIFGEEPPKEEHKTGKVFEYPDKPQDQSVPDEEIDYSHEHLEEFMRSLNEHNKNANFKQGLENPNDEPSDYGNNTLNPQQTDHLINEFLQNVSNNQKNAQNPKKESNEVLTRRAGSDILSSNPDRIMSHHTGATLSNSLAYSQSNASALGVGQFNSIGLLSGVKSRQRDPPEDDNVEKIELESEQKNEPAEEEKGNDEDDEFERSESGIIDV